MPESSRARQLRAIAAGRCKLCGHRRYLYAELCDAHAAQAREYATARRRRLGVVVCEGRAGVCGKRPMGPATR